MKVAVGAVLAFAGAVLAFALQPGQTPNWTALGLVVLIAGFAVLLAWGAVQLSSVVRSHVGGQVRQTGENESAENCSGSRPAPGSDRALGGLLAVVSGILAVVILGVVTLALLGTNATDNSSTVAVATTAFGAISAVVGAYLGVKIGAEQGKEATATAREATATAQKAVEEIKADRANGDPSSQL